MGFKGHFGSEQRQRGPKIIKQVNKHMTNFRLMTYVKRIVVPAMLCVPRPWFL